MKMIRRLSSGTLNKKSVPAKKAKKTIDHAALNMGFDAADEDLLDHLAGKSAWGERAVDEAAAATKLQARSRGQQARRQSQLKKQLSVVDEASMKTASIDEASMKTASTAAVEDTAELEAAASKLSSEAEARAKALKAEQAVLRAAKQPREVPLVVGAVEYPKAVKADASPSLFGGLFELSCCSGYRGKA